MMYCANCVRVFIFFFFKQKTAYEMLIRDWSSDVCSSDLMMDTGMAGRIGNTVTINGRLPDTFPVRAGERLRLRLINAANARIFGLERSEERRVGKEWVSTCRYRWSPHN